jgi:hypothetical protein
LTLATTPERDELNTNPAHLLLITDDTGLFQHCRYSIPDYKHGYTLDDNVRAMIVAARTDEPLVAARLPTYLRFVTYCQREDGLFRNFVGYDRRFLEEKGSTDSHGRTLWALGVVYREQPAYRPLAEEMLLALLPQLPELRKYARSTAFAILGLHHYLAATPGQPKIEAELVSLADALLARWQTSPKTTNWQWFENSLTYENARLPQALFAAYASTGQKRFLEIAQKAAGFLEKVHFKHDYVKLVGNKGWLFQDQAMAEFDEQPVDAGALVELYAQAYAITGAQSYADLAKRCIGWYLGRNCHGLKLYNQETGGCCDALTAGGVNLNQGSESILSYYLAYQSLRATRPTILL